MSKLSTIPGPNKGFNYRKVLNRAKKEIISQTEALEVIRTRRKGTGYIPTRSWAMKKKGGDKYEEQRTANLRKWEQINDDIIHLMGDENIESSLILSKK